MSSTTGPGPTAPSIAPATTVGPVALTVTDLARTRDCTYSDGLILLIYFFAAICNRSVSWASDLANWPLWCRAAPSCSGIGVRPMACGSSG